MKFVYNQPILNILNCKLIFIFLLYLLMRNEILHIGLGKCGSTFLQKAIFPEIEKKLK